MQDLIRKTDLPSPPTGKDGERSGKPETENGLGRRLADGHLQGANAVDPTLDFVAG
jgi:hypothetical protein